MKSRHSREIRHQRPKPNKMQIAQERGIFAVRRVVSQDSYYIFDSIAESLEVPVKVENAGRIFRTDSIGVTVIGFSRFDSNHRQYGPPTSHVIRDVESANSELEVKLTDLAVFGGGSKHKLGFKLESKILEDEIANFEQAFYDRGQPLRKDPKNHDNGATPHCSVAFLFEDFVGFFEDERTLSRLGKVCMKYIDGSPDVLLEPAAPHEPIVLL